MSKMFRSMCEPALVPSPGFLNGRGGRIDRAHASAGEVREFEYRSSQTNDLHNVSLSLPSLAPDIIKIGQASSVFG